MCFAYAFALGLAKHQRDKDPGNSTHYVAWVNSHLKTKYWLGKQIAYSVHTSVSLEYTEPATYKEIAELADKYFVQVIFVSLVIIL